MRTQASRGRPHFGLTVDVRGAHRTIVIRLEDWPLLACQLTPGGDVFVNRVGTFGISSASYWWGRLAEAIQRAELQVVSRAWLLCVVLYADDHDLTAEGSTYQRALLCFMWWLVMLKVPLSWPKLTGLPRPERHFKDCLNIGAVFA